MCVFLFRATTNNILDYRCAWTLPASLLFGFIHTTRLRGRWCWRDATAKGNEMPPSCTGSVRDIRCITIFGPFHDHCLWIHSFPRALNGHVTSREMKSVDGNRRGENEAKPATSKITWVEEIFSRRIPVFAFIFIHYC